MKSVISLNEAQDLPERPPFDIIYKRQVDGSVLCIPTFKKMVSVDLVDKTIMVFIDRDGRAMNIDYAENGAFKFESS